MTDGEWPPEGVSVPAFDPQDMCLVGWDMGNVAHGEFEDCPVLQTGRCGDHSQLILPPGASIVCDENGQLEVRNVVFSGPGRVRHDPGCPSFTPDGEREDG